MYILYTIFLLYAEDFCTRYGKYKAFVGMKIFGEEKIPQRAKADYDS